MVKSLGFSCGFQSSNPYPRNNKHGNFNSGQFQGSQCTNDEGTFLAHCGHWRYKKVTAYMNIYIYMYIWDIQGPLFTNHLHKLCPIWFIHSSALRKSKMAGWEIHHECRCKIFLVGKTEDFQPIILVYQKVSSSRFCCWMGHMEGKGSILGYLNFFGPNIHRISVETT